MITTSKFVFLHLHKSGGTFVNEFLLRFVPDAHLAGYHLPRRMIPPAHAHLPVLGFVRNPWSYYVSWYTFQSKKANPNALFRLVSEDNSLGFEATIDRLLDLEGNATLLDTAVAVLPNGYRNRGINLPGFELEAIRGSGRGFYSFLYRHIYDGAGMTLIRPMERLREELPWMLGAVGETVTSSMRDYLEDAPAQNESGHRHYRDFYGDGLRQRIAQCDRALIESHGYRFGD
jgi:hypothetical protein